MAEFTGPTNDIVGDAIIAEIADQTMELRMPAGETATLDLRNKDAVAEVIFAEIGGHVSFDTGHKA